MLEGIAGEGRILSCGAEEKACHKGRIRRVRTLASKEDFDRLLSAYDFGQAVFISRRLTYQRLLEEDLDDFRHFLHLCRRHRLTKILCVFPADLYFHEKDSKKLELGFAEELCDYYRDSGPMEIKILHSPYLMDPAFENDYAYQMFETLEAGGDWTFEEDEDKPVNFIDKGELADLLAKLLTNWDMLSDLMSLPGAGWETFGAIARRLSLIYPNAKISCAYRDRPVYPPEDTISPLLDWKAEKNPMSNLEALRRIYLDKVSVKPSLWKRIMDWFTSANRLVIGLELVLGAILTEVLNHFLDNNAQFRVIDVRLIFVVIMASIYGVNTGLIAAVLMCLSLLRDYMSQGLTLAMTFYSPENWLPYILLLVVSAVCGYVKEKREEDLSILSDQLKQTEEEKKFTEDLYQEALDHKNEYKKNLIQSRDGFGRIFDVVQRLNNLEPSRIYQESIGVMEDILDTRSVAIYSISEKNPNFARLEVSSSALQGRLQKSVRLEDYKPLMASLRQGEIWTNRELIPDYPSYAAPIMEKGQLRLFLVIRRVSFDQMSTYYENLIRIVAGLITEFMLTAWRYQKTVWAEDHIGDSNILTEQAFRRELEILHDTAHQDRLSFSLLRISAGGRSLDQMSRLLSGLLRESDLLGKGQDGDYYVLARQTDENAEKVLLERLKKEGLECEAVELEK
jgi:hypothetical protein